MFEFLTQSNDDAITILKSDHIKVKDLFDRFERVETLREKKQIAKEAIQELKIHAEIEEKIFYPALRPQLESKVMNEADEEHHVAKVLIAELDGMDGSEDHYEAKFKVLAENVRHHIREEESEMMPKARALDLDFDALGKTLLARKEELKEHGVAPSDEEKLISRRQGSFDSPARAAHAKPSRRKPTQKSAAGKSVGKKVVRFAKKSASKVKRAAKSMTKPSRGRAPKAKKAQVAAGRSQAASRNRSRASR